MTASSTPRIWGIVNVTPDSFSDGGRFDSTATAVAHATQLRADGADVLDIGGESTRPGATPVAPDAEAARVVPVIRALREAGDAGPISVDTRRASVATAALEAGATIVNDVSSAQDPEMLPVVASRGAGLVLMHMQGEPGTMQEAPTYADVVREVGDYLAARCAAARSAGIERIWVDPGIGFGKTLAHNLALLRDLEALARPGTRTLLGASRKSFLGQLTDEPRADRRLAGSLACVVRAMHANTDVRVHDVRETKALLTVLSAISPPA